MFLFRSSPEPQTPAPSATEAGINRVTSAIAAAAEKTGVAFDYLLRTAQRESSLQPTAQAPTSSARGLYQFIDQTWLTMVRDEGRRFGLDRYADQIGRGANGRPTVTDAGARDQILALRDDPKVSALMAGAFTVRNADELRASTGRNPTEGELYMAHFLGSGGASRLISLNAANPQASAARHFPEAADANQRIFFDRGRPRTVSEVYQVLAAGAPQAPMTLARSQTPAAPSPQPAQASPPAAPAVSTPDPGTWAPIARINADPSRPFHSMFASSEGAVSASAAQAWGAYGMQRREIAPDAAPANASMGRVDPGRLPPVTRAGLGGPFESAPRPAERPAPPDRNQPLDLTRFRRPEARGT